MRHACRFTYLVVVIVAVGLSAVATPVLAAPSEADLNEARTHYERGKRLYDLREYVQAVPEFEEAYRLSGDAVFLYNIAQSYRLTDRLDDAIHYYETYLKREPETPRRAEVERRLEELRRTQNPPNQVDEPGVAPTADPNDPNKGQGAEMPPPPVAAPYGYAPSPSGAYTPAPQPAPINAPPRIIPVNGPAPRQGSGLVWGGTLGVGFIGATVGNGSETQTWSGPSFFGSLQLGTEISPGTALMVDLGMYRTTSLSDTSDSNDTFRIPDASMTLVSLGVLARHYFAPSSGMFAFGGGGLQWLIFNNADVDDDVASVGFGVKGGAGIDLFSGDANGGLLAFLHVGANGTADKWMTDDVFATVAFIIAGHATFY